MRTLLPQISKETIKRKKPKIPASQQEVFDVIKSQQKLLEKKNNRGKLKTAQKLLTSIKNLDMEKKQVKNLIYKLFVDKNSILYGRNIKDVTDNFIKKKLSKSKYKKDVFFYDLLNKNKLLSSKNIK